MGGARHPVPDQLPRFDPAFSPANSADDPHLLRAIGRAWIWRRRMEAGEFAKVHDLAKAVGLPERHVCRQLRLAYLSPTVLKRLTCGPESLVVSLMSLVEATAAPWPEQANKGPG